MAAVVAGGKGAVLSHFSAAALWGLQVEARMIDLTVPPTRHPRMHGVRVHRLDLHEGDPTESDRIPVTTPERTIIDLATRLPLRRVERVVNEADRLGLVTVEQLRAGLSRMTRQRGLPALRALLDSSTFVRTDSELESQFLDLVRDAGLPLPRTGALVNGFKVDFFWPEFGLVVETDGLRYHRTPLQQRRDLERDQAHAASGLVPLRFTHHQVTGEADFVTSTLKAIVDSRSR